MKTKSNLLLLFWVAFLFYHCTSSSKNKSSNSLQTNATDKSTEQTQVSVKEEWGQEKAEIESYGEVSIEYPEMPTDNGRSDSVVWYPAYFPGTNKKAADVPAGSKVTFGQGKKEKIEKTTASKAVDSSVKKKSDVSVQVKQKESAVVKEKTGTSFWIQIAIGFGVILSVIGLFYWAKNKL